MKSFSELAFLTNYTLFVILFASHYKCKNVERFLYISSVGRVSFPQLAE